jgi:anti-sigma regulatory factor (Ser/Thr protein kinase)
MYVSNPPPRPPDRSFDLPAEPESVPDARHRIRTLIERFGVGAADAQAITLALSEVVTNTVKHAYRPDDDPPGPVQIRAWIEDEDVVLLVRDVGRGPSLFAARSDGLGLRIVRSLTSDFDLHRVAGGGTEILMRFERGGGGHVEFMA